MKGKDSIGIDRMVELAEHALKRLGDYWRAYPDLPPGRMRDDARRERILKMLSAYWRTNPDLRLGQIIFTITPAGTDPFYVEDDVIERKLRGLDVAREEKG
jgi:hypothetical protein